MSELERLLRLVGEAGPDELLVIADAMEEAGDPRAAGLRVVSREGYRPWRSHARDTRWWWYWEGCPNGAKGEVTPEVFRLLDGRLRYHLGKSYQSASDAVLDLARVMSELGKHH